MTHLPQRRTSCISMKYYLLKAIFLLVCLVFDFKQRFYWTPIWFYSNYNQLLKIRHQLLIPRNCIASDNICLLTKTSHIQKLSPWVHAQSLARYLVYDIWVFLPECSWLPILFTVYIEINYKPVWHNHFANISIRFFKLHHDIGTVAVRTCRKALALLNRPM